MGPGLYKQYFSGYCLFLKIIVSDSLGIYAWFHNCSSFGAINSAVSFSAIDDGCWALRYSLELGPMMKIVKRLFFVQKRTNNFSSFQSNWSEGGHGGTGNESNKCRISHFWVICNTKSCDLFASNCSLTCWL